jgi:hypothetical protein
VDVNTTVFVTTVVALVTTNLGALYFLTGQLSDSIEGLGTRLDSRIDRLDGRIDLLQSTVADRGARLTLLERRGDGL